MRTNPQQMRMGMRVEREHTADPAVAAAIACDHLQELPDYYTRLARMERGVGSMAETRPATVDQVSKAQWIRVLDVVVIGPLMIGGGLAWRKRRPLLGLALAAFGVATVWYNGKNYLANR